MSAFLTHLMYDNGTNKEALKKPADGVGFRFLGLLRFLFVGSSLYDGLITSSGVLPGVCVK